MINGKVERAIYWAYYVIEFKGRPLHYKHPNPLIYSLNSRSYLMSRMFLFERTGINL